jgi:hypothetical protein
MQIPFNMNMRLDNVRTLIIPDVHLDWDWVRAILEQEEGNWEQLVFLGDYFDSFDRPPVVASAGQMAEFLLELEREYNGKVHFLIGNHDTGYLELLGLAKAGGYGLFPMDPCSGFSMESAVEISKVLDTGFRNRCRLFVECNGYLISHAGVHPKFWRADHPGIEEPLESLDELCRIAMEYLGKKRLPILGCGAARGGPEEVGGITWLDWNSEFEDDERMPPQIVGHTPYSLGPRQNGRSWCIDGNQSCWAILDRDGSLEIRYLAGMS